jgi:hypothetical protein
MPSEPNRVEPLTDEQKGRLLPYLRRILEDEESSKSQVAEPTQDTAHVSGKVE